MLSRHEQALLVSHKLFDFIRSRRLSMVLIGLGILCIAAYFLKGKIGSHLLAPDRTAAKRSMQQAQQFFQNGQIPQALTALAAATRQDPTWAEPFFTEAKLMERSGHAAEARNEALIAHKLDPSDKEITMKALRLDSLMVRPVETEKLAREAVVQTPTSAETHLLLGQAIVSAEKPERFQEAITELEEAHRLDISFAPPLIEMGKLYSREGNNRKAEVLLLESGHLLDKQVTHQPVSLNELQRWITERQTVAFTLTSVYRRMGRRADSQKAALLAEKASACSDKLTMLRGRGSLSPPDTDARSQLRDLCQNGVGFFRP